MEKMAFPATPKKEKVRIIKAFIVFTIQANGQSDGKKIKAEIKFPSKLSPKDEAELDPDSVALMCFPDGTPSVALENIETESNVKSAFHTFVITKQDGSRLYGSTLVVTTIQGIVNGPRVKAYCLLSAIPFVVPMYQLLLYFWESKCEPSTLVQRICNLKVPSKGKYLKLMLPPIPSSMDRSLNSRTNHEVFIYRGTTEYPIFDYSLRKLFKDILSPANFLKVLSAALLEYQILIISRDYKKLMMVSESLITLLHPFKWQHVYVPILPAKLGFHYLDAPTPYIMGITRCPGNNESSSQAMSMVFQSLPSISSNQCHVYCDDDRVEHVQGGHSWSSCFPQNDGHNSIESTASNDDSSFNLPPFYNSLLDAIERILSTKIEDVSAGFISNVVKIRDNNVVAVEKVMKVSTSVDDQRKSTSDNNYLNDLVLNQSIRMICRETIQDTLLNNFERFLITTSSSQSCKFDSVSFLSDQPEKSRKFLTAFFETQMFATFIDEMSGKRRHRKGSLFEVQFDSGLPVERPEGQDNIAIIGITDSIPVKRKGDDGPELLSSVNKVFSEAIEDATCVDLNESNPAISCYSPRAQRKVYDGIKADGNRLFSPRKERLLDLSPAKNSINQNETAGGFETIDLQDGLRNIPSALAAHTNWTVVESLLRETRNKTKRIVLENMAKDDGPSHGFAVDFEAMEGGNTLITSLCDLIERVWIHGRANELNPLVTGSSSFWSHLIQYCHKLETTAANQMKEEEESNSTLSWSILKKNLDSLSQSSFLNKSQLVNKSLIRSLQSVPSTPEKRGHSSSLPSHSNSSPCSPCSSSHSKRLLFGASQFHSSTLPNMKPNESDDPLTGPYSPPTTLIYDVKSVLRMTDVKTDIGRSRAFIRLSLERKLLSKHVRTLLSDADLLTGNYKRYAFLRSDEEREQFITHLLTLNAVDLNCFTFSFITSTFNYKFISVGVSGSLNGFVSLCGTFNTSGDIPIDRSRMNQFIDTDQVDNGQIFRFKHKNFGCIKYMKLYLVQTGKVFIEHFLVQNETTGQTFKFPCNKWLGPNVDDGGSEFFFTACELVTYSFNKCRNKSKNWSTRQWAGGHWSKNSSHRFDDLTLDQLQGLLKDKVQGIMKLPSIEGCLSEDILQIDQFNDTVTLVPLSERRPDNNHSCHTQSQQQVLSDKLLSDDGLLQLIKSCFYFGFKNRTRSSFRKQSFVWDYILRLQLELKLSFKSLGNNNIHDNELKTHLIETKKSNWIEKKFIEMVEGISCRGVYLGKDSKLLLFLLLSIRDKLLSPHFMRLLAGQSGSTRLYYDHNSFLTNPVLTNYMIAKLNQLNQIENLFVDHFLTKGL